MRILDRVALTATLIGAVLVAAPATLAQDARFGPLTALTEGFLDPWDLDLNADGYRMENTDDTSSIRYVWATSPEPTHGSRTLTTWIDMVDSNPLSNAGLLYGFEEQDDGSTFYYMFMLRPGNQVTLYRRDVDGVETITSTVTDAVVPGTNELSIEESGDQIALLVNGQTVGLLGGIEGVGTGRVGIVAWGTGTFLFEGFEDSSPVSPGGKGPAAGTPPPAK